VGARFGLLALSVGVVMAADIADGEAGSALPVGPRARIGARLVTVGGAAVGATGLIVMFSRVSTGLMGRIFTEAGLLLSVAVLIASIGSRLWVRYYSTRAAVLLPVTFIGSWLVPHDRTPWWSGLGPEPTRVPWFIAMGVSALLAFLITRHAHLLQFPDWLRFRRPRTPSGDE
jgi:hypothetical protein